MQSGSIKRYVMYFAAALLGASINLTAQTPTDSTLSKQKPLAVLEQHHAGVTSVKFSPKGNLLATADLAGRIVLWRTDSWAPLRTFNHGSEVYAVAFSPDGKMLASSGGDCKVILWNASTGTRMRSIPNDRRALAVVFAPNGDLLIGAEDGKVRVMDPATGKDKRALNAGGTGSALAVSADGSTLATALPIRVWDYRTLKRKVNQQALGQLGLALSPDGKRLASAESTGGALLWNLADSVTYVPLRALEEKRAIGPRGYESFSVNMPVSGIDMSRNADLGVGGGTTGLVYVWKPTGTQPPVPIKLDGHTMTVTAVALSPNGELVASASLDRTVRIWKVAANANAFPFSYRIGRIVLIIAPWNCSFRSSRCCRDRRTSSPLSRWSVRRLPARLCERALDQPA